MHSQRLMSSNKDVNSLQTPDVNKTNTLNKFKVFRESDAPVILDIYEEKLKYAEILENNEEEPDAFEGINIERRQLSIHLHVLII